MFKDVTELKNFITWARKQGLQRVKVGDIEFEISIIRQALDHDAKATEEKDTSKTLIDTEVMTKEEEEELLYFSSN